MLAGVNGLTAITHLTTHVFKVRTSLVRVFDRAVHLFKRF